MIVLAGVAPDVDGLGLIPEALTRNSSHPLLWFTEYHHSLHTLLCAVVVAAVAYFVSARRKLPPDRNLAADPDRAREKDVGQVVLSSHPAVTAGLAFLSFHLHLFCDLIGARGPDGYAWPIPYLKPFSNSLQLSWRGQWALNAWPNFAITGVLLMMTFWLAWKDGTSPLELVSERWNQEFVQALRKRFPSRNAIAASTGK